MANNLGEKIYELRKKQNLTQEDLALLMKISDKSISKWENSITLPTIENLKRLAVIFDISIDELLEYTKEKTKKTIKKIVLTGGPCAGKTTAFNWIQNNFSKQGYKVLFIPESATELITSGIAPWETSSTLDFQETIIKMQMEKEKIYEECARKLPFDKILLVCDRGVIDGKAFMSKRDFNYLLKSLKVTESDLKDSYDAVFHLVSAAKGAKEFYNLDNPARTETIEEAIKSDNALINAWTGHSHLRVIDNSSDFEEKMKRLMREISGVLGEPNPYEIERKFLIKKPNVEFLESLPNCEKVQIYQTYLKSKDDDEVRIRQRGSNGSFTYSKTRKINVSGIKRVEIETRLTQEEYLNELLNADPNKGQIIKDRYCLCYENQYFEIDIYPFLEEEAIVEIELISEKEKIKFPDFLDIIEEVTDNLDYRNSAIAASLVRKYNA